MHVMGACHQRQLKSSRGRGYTEQFLLSPLHAEFLLHADVTCMSGRAGEKEFNAKAHLADVIWPTSAPHNAYSEDEFTQTLAGNATLTCNDLLTVQNRQHNVLSPNRQHSVISPWIHGKMCRLGRTEEACTNFISAQAAP